METPSTIGQSVTFSRQVFPFLPFSPFFPPTDVPVSRLPDPFSFEVTVARPIFSTSQAFSTWSDALAFAAQLWNRARAGEFGAINQNDQVRVVVRDQRGVLRSYPEEAVTFSPPVSPFPFFPRSFARPLYPFRSRLVTLSGPYGHFDGDGAVGQAPAFQLVNGLQQFPPALAQSIATNLAAMYWQPSGATRSYVAYSPAEYERVTGNAAPSVGYPPEASEPGAIILVNPATIRSVNGPLDQASVIVAGDRGTAAQFAGPGGMYGVVFPLAAEAPARRQISPAVIAAGVAAAVAALLIFT